MKGIRHKRERDFRESLGGAKRQNGFCDITREHPTESSKLGRSLHVTEEAVSIDSNERPHLAIDAIIQSGTTEIPPLLSSWIARAFFIYSRTCLKNHSRKL